MKLSKHNLNNDQPKTLSRRDDKKSVNIKWNSNLFFQLGLILCLLTAYFVMQTKFETKEIVSVTPKINYLEEPPMVFYTIEKPEIIKKKKTIRKQPKIEPKIINKIIKLKKDNALETDLSGFEKSTKKDEDFPKGTIIEENSNENKFVNIIGVQHVPIYPGCEFLSSNIERRNCMSLKIKKFIQRKFNTDKFDNINTKGKQRITVQFYIDENGNVSEVIARAIDKSLEKEAIRVVSKLPQMKPGRQGDKVVKVQYRIPIVFKID